MKESSSIKQINAAFNAMDKTLTQMGKVLRQQRKLEAQENERKLCIRDLKLAAENLDMRHASPRSRRIVLTGFNEYWRVTGKYFHPAPVPPLDQGAPGLLLSEIAEQPIAWLWQDYLPLGALTLLEGEPGSGTSLLALHLAACVSSGCALPGGSPGLQGTVVLVAPQDHASSTIKPRFLAAGGDPARVLLLHTVEQVDSEKVTIEDRPFSLAQDLCFLEEAITRTHAALVILDSLDTCRPSDLRQALPALNQLAQHSGCAILLVCPLAPAQATAAPKPGSLDLLRAVRSSLRILSDPEDQERQRLLVVTKHALCAQPPILSFQLCPSQQGILTLDWLGSYTRPIPPYEDGDFPPLSCRNHTLLRQRIVSALESSAAPLNARSLTTLTGFNYELVRKTLQRMFDKQDLVSPARGLYTTQAHPCLEQQPAAPTATPPPETPAPPVAPVPGEPPIMPDDTTSGGTTAPPVTPVPGEPQPVAPQSTPAEPLVPDVASVPTVPGTPQLPESAHDPSGGSPKPSASDQEGDACSISTTPLSQSSQLSQMEYRTLGRTGWKISPIGFGAWGIGGDWGPTDDNTSLAALHRAIDLGVNFIDTADVYGNGHSEQLIAQVRKARSEPLIIATTIGRKLNPRTAQGYSRQNLAAFVERSLRNLEMEALDLLQLHCPPSEVYDMPEAFGILDELVQQGKIRSYGVSVERVDEALKAVTYPNVQSVQLIFNLFRLKPSKDFFSVARERQVGIVARVPLASGLLTGKFRPDTPFDPSDHRSFNRHGEAFDQGETFSGVAYEEGLHIVEELRPFVPQGATMAQLALRWILMFPEVTSAIPGGKNPRQVEENVGAAALPPLSPATMSEVELINDICF